MRRVPSSAAVAALLLAAFLLPGCGTPPQAQGAEVMTVFLKDLESGRYEAAVQLVRARDGSPLTPTAAAQLIEVWKRNLGPSGGAFQIAAVRFDFQVPLGEDVLREVHAERGLQLTASIDGTSSLSCFRLPVRNFTARVAAYGNSWYVLQDMFTAYEFRCP